MLKIYYENLKYKIFFSLIIKENQKIKKKKFAFSKFIKIKKNKFIK
jgi:hypothetical protein